MPQLLPVRAPTGRRCALRRRLRLPAAIGLLIALLGGLATALPSAASTPVEPATIGLRLVDGPSDRAGDPRALQYVVDHLAPGAVIARRIEVRNDSPVVQSVQLYAAAASVQGGQFRFGAGRAANELTRWTGISRPMVRVAPRAKRLVTLMIAVPASAPSGERYGVVWAEVTAARNPQGVTAVNRVGIRMYLSVGKGGEPASDFSIRSIEARRDAKGNPSVVAMVSNTGERAVDLSGSLSLRNGPGGLSAGPFPADLGTTLGIGETEPVRIPVDRAVPAGTWSVRIDLRSGTVVRSATARVAFPRAATSSSGPVVVAASAAGGGRFLWSVIAGLLLLVLGLGALLLTRRRSGPGE